MGWYEERFTFGVGRGRVNQKCVMCGVDMWLPQSKLHWHLTCSVECKSAKNEKVRRDRMRKCSQCGVEFTPRKYQIDIGGGVYCSQRCNVRSRDQVAENNAAWRGGIVKNSNGYVLQRLGSEYVLQHRIAVGVHLGRKLGPDEVVHHKNRDTADNRIENLQVMSRSEHAKLHHRERKEIS